MLAQYCAHPEPRAHLPYTTRARTAHRSRESHDVAVARMYLVLTSVGCGPGVWTRL